MDSEISVGFVLGEGGEGLSFVGAVAVFQLGFRCVGFWFGFMGGFGEGGNGDAMFHACSIFEAFKFGDLVLLIGEVL